MEHICPVCHKPVKVLSQDRSKETQFFPFCSRRCKLVDLGGWLDAEYKIISSSQLHETDEVFNSSTGDPLDKH